MRRTDITLGAVAIVGIALLWLLPPAGFVLVAGVLVVAPPWGRTLTERGIISVVVVAGLVAITIPRSSEVPVTQASARIGLAVLVLAAVAVRLVPALRERAAIPRPRIADGLVAALVVVLALWLMSAYVGANAYEIVSGLFFTGWDNQGHFVPFANTVEVGATTWPTIDGAIAWNQWYPSLHTTLWALATQATHAARPDRIGLLWPYVQWTSISFALSIGALAWIAGDLARRLARALLPDRQRVAAAAALAAIAAFAAFALLGSPTGLFNAGFTNFVMAVAITATTAYFASRSLASARHIGWLLVPLGALAVIGLWTPLVLGIAPAGVVVLVALLRRRTWLGIAWAVVTVLLVAGTTIIQTRAIVNVAGTDAGSFTQDLGAVSSGMVPFNVGLALVAPVVVALLAVLLVRRRQIPLAVAVAGVPIAIVPFLVLAVLSARAAHISWLTSYYVLKTLDAVLLFTAPVLAALAALAAATVIALVAASRLEAVLSWLVAACLAVAGFGYFGLQPAEFKDGFAAAPGIAAGSKRLASVQNSLVGEAVVSAAVAARAHPDTFPLLWDGSGNLPNLWLASLAGVMSRDQQTFYLSLPPFPYDAAAKDYVMSALATHPEQRAAVYWFRTVSGEQLQSLQAALPNQVTLVRVPMRSSALCQECSLQ